MFCRRKCELNSSRATINAIICLGGIVQSVNASMCLIAGHHNYKFWQVDGFILFILPSKPKNQITTISATSLFPKRKTWLHYISTKTASFFSPIHQSCTRLTINRTITSFMKDRWLTSMISPLAESCRWQKGTNLKLAQNSNNR